MRFFILRVTSWKKGRSAFGRNIIEYKLKNQIIMNREIKFRGIKKSDRTIITGDLSHIGNALFIFNKDADGDNLNSPDDYIIDSETLGQFTGFKDKNGKEIYEGDILKRREIINKKSKTLKNRVFWNNITGCWHLDTSIFQDKMHSVELWMELSDFEYKVIGNIHENKINSTHE